MATFQQIIDEARVILNDQVIDSNTVTRYTEAQLLGYIRQAVIEARRVRPDLFMSNLTAAFPPFAVTDTVPVPEEYHLCLSDYAAHRAELRDDEFAVDGRASTLFQKFKSGLMGV
jgi:hypothetical protein